TMMANRMVGALPENGWKITVIDRDDVHVYQPGLLFLPFHGYREEEIIKPRGSLLDPACEYVLDDIDRVDPAQNVVALKSGRRVDYDILIIATGSHIRPEQTPGLTGRHWQKDIFDFYSLEGARNLAKRLDAFEGGRVVIDTVEMPIKCPVAPLEFAFLADAYFRERGMRDKVEMVYATPLDGAFTKPKASAAFGSMMQDRGINVVTNFAASAVDEDEKRITSYDGQDLPFDLLVTIPLHGGSEAILRSELGDDIGFVPTDKHTLQSKAHENIFVIGDATDVPASKAGAVAHFEGDVLADNLLRYIGQRPLEPGFDGHANCFIETGNGKAMLIDFNYETEPLPGRFPLPGIGPFSLLEESEINHWGKLGFKWVYWNILVKGGELPLDHRMLMAGKRG
ncbi:MAG: NAD(P)/FAD-dependent oxidoreductase, partial [Deltaproteobacteria bacterium]|nr:NAD(P)/FAD-dependent oxidoreductase [Deltaproteobacteria bacterium]